MSDHPSPTDTPTKGGNVVMPASDTPTNGVGGMSEADTKFLIECLKNTKDVVTVDIEAVASSLQYSNRRSVGNRLGLLRKRYGLAITTSSVSAKAATTTDVTDATDAATGPENPLTTPEKVKKPRAPRTPRKPKVEAAGAPLNPGKVTKAEPPKAKKPRAPRKPAGEGKGRRKVTVKAEPEEVSNLDTDANAFIEAASTFKVESAEEGMEEVVDLAPEFSQYVVFGG
ncbi:MAG: hypothetical protein M1816_000754 [Peltula sp. TS41687]|nr:MAG: hypothetical protein M1816_000754 [Peltula sp. TS41687]